MMGKPSIRHNGESEGNKLIQFDKKNIVNKKKALQNSVETL